MEKKIQGGNAFVHRYVPITKSNELTAPREKLGGNHPLSNIQSFIQINQSKSSN